MRAIAILVVLSTLAVIVGSAAMVVGKDYEPRLDVQIKGVPGYIYYNRSYDITVEYANHGGAIKGPVEVSVVLPETFALAERIGDPARHGETLTWSLRGLDSGETGSILITVRGTLPEDLTNAVYDLPGYVGHTAFVEGFLLQAAIKAGSSSAETTAVADTGTVVSGTLQIRKVCIGNSSGFFDIYAINSQQQTSLIAEDVFCGETRNVTIASGGYQLFEWSANQQSLIGYSVAIGTAAGDDCTPQGVITIVTGPIA